MKNYLRLIAFGMACYTNAFTQCPTVSISGTSVNCYGGNDGSVTISISPVGSLGASGTYFVSWSDPGTGTDNNLTINGKVPGTYTANVKNNTTGCVVNAVYTVNEPNPILMTGVVSNVDCFGNSTGSINLSVVGGTGSGTYWYDWNYNGVTPFPGDSEDPSGLAAGTHTVIVKDANNCQQTATYTVTQPTGPLNSTNIKADVSCFNGNNGSIDLFPYGGTAPYVFSWNNDGTADGFTDPEDIANLSAGSYTVQVKDNKNCLYSNTIVINQPTAQITTSATSTPVSCFGYSNGQATVIAAGGTPPYNYQWSSSTFVYAQNSPTLTNVPAGTYSVVVTDSKGCQKTQSGIVISSPTLLTITNPVVVDVKCYGEATGSVSHTISGGTPNYTYVWTGASGVVSSSANATGLIAGDYNFTVTDNNSCVATASYTIDQPNAPLGIITNDITHVKCYGLSTGGVDIIATGGTPNYTFIWSNLAVSEDLTSVTSGVYSVTVTDANLCTESASYTITQPAAPLNATSLISNVVCYGESNGVINVTTTGGTTPYLYEWVNSTYQLSSFTEDLINYPSDTYSLVITDANNCLFSDVYVITQPNELTGTITGVDILCKNEATGSVDVTITPGAGTAPYQFMWNNSATSEDLSNLIAGTYSVTVTDDHLCELDLSITLVEPQDSLSFVFESFPVICYGEDNGSIVLTAEGGTPNYDFAWSSGDNTATINYLTAGWYTFLITDDHGCQISDSIEVIQPDLLIAIETVTDVSCNGFSDGGIDILPVGGNGGYNYTWFNSTFTLSSQEQDLFNVPSDVYQLELRDTLGCFTEIFVEVSQPDPIVISLATVDVVCAGGSTGSISISVTGGTPSYSYLWSNGATTANLIDVPVDEYTVVVTDANNCVDSASAIIYEPDPIKIDFSVTEVTCIDQVDGTVWADPSGGTGDFTFLWSNDQTTQLIENLLGGYYSVTVMDIVGCTMSDTTFVPTNPSACINPPNAFSPNNDAYNDTWFFDNAHIYPNAEMNIYNRWGTLVYRHVGVYEPWDGTVNGVEMPSDVYYFIYNLNFPNREPLVGNITIVR